MNDSRSRILLIAGLAIVLLLLAVLGLAVVLWGWPPFEVKGFSWN
jgi:uncharacterized membrane protein YqjE